MYLDHWHLKWFWYNQISICHSCYSFLLIIFLYSPFSIYRISSDGPSFISGISNFCLLFFLVSLAGHINFINLFKKPSFNVIIPVYNFIDFCFFITFSSAYFIFPPLSSFLRWKTEGKRRRGWQKTRWLDSITDSVGTNLSKLQEKVEDGGTWCAAVHGVAKRRTRLSDWTTTKMETASWEIYVQVKKQHLELDMEQ